MKHNIPVSLTRNDEVMVLIFDGPTCIYIAGFSDRQAAEASVKSVLDFAIGYYEVKDPTSKVIG